MRKTRRTKKLHTAFTIAAIGALFVVLFVALGRISFFPATYRASDKNSAAAASIDSAASSSAAIPPVTVASASDTTKALDKVLYDKKMLELANIPLVSKCVNLPATSTTALHSTSTSSSTKHVTSTTKSQTVKSCTTAPAVSAWPTKAPYPNAGALLPFNRIVAYYGNFYSTKMGVLGQYPIDVLIPKLQGEIAKWKEADPNTPVIPAVDYIVSTAQGAPGDDGKYRLRMPDDQIQKAIDLAAKIGGIVFLDVQTGQSTMEAEIPHLEKYLKLPQVHLALDPEFTMKSGQKPGTRIGTIDAVDVNFAAQYLAKIVRDNNLSPKILVVHRFTDGMVTHSGDIKSLPEVQVVMDMDGWGDRAHKIAAYNQTIRAYPVQFTGLKLFYKNDIRASSTGMLTPREVLKLNPQPIYIQYQ